MKSTKINLTSLLIICLVIFANAGIHQIHGSVIKSIALLSFKINAADDPVVLEEWLSSEKPVYVVTKEIDYLKIRDIFPAPFHIVIREWIDHRYVLLLSNRPADGL